MSIGILGGNGLLGSDLTSFLSKNHTVEAITRENYEKKKGNKYNVLINANGNSKRFWANQNPKKDFLASTVSVYKSIFDFPCDLYVYISSPDVYENHSSPLYTQEDREIDPINLQPYGFHKYLSELIVKKYTEKFLILRLAMILGTNLKKGPFYDLIHDVPLSITLKSRLQLITTQRVAELIGMFIKNKVHNEIINIGGKGTFEFTQVRKYFGRKIQVSHESETQIYEMNVEKVSRWFSPLKTSREYLREFVNDS